MNTNITNNRITQMRNKSFIHGINRFVSFVVKNIVYQVFYA